MKAEEETIENNVQGVCLECITESIEKFNANLPDVKPGDYVKAKFNTGLSSCDGPASESMWVQVDQVTKDSYIGTLENTPFFVSKNIIRYGSNVEVKMEQCWAHLPKSE